MKGMVLRAFAAFAEETFGADVADRALSQSALSTRGVFTNVGYYPTDDMLLLVRAVSEATHQPPSDLVRRFGRDLFGRLARAHAPLMAAFDEPLDMLASIESVIHVNVRKLYTDTELPSFDVAGREGARRLVLVYRSARPFADLAEGLILGCLDHYGVGARARVRRRDLADDGTAAAFTVEIDDRDDCVCATPGTTNSTG